MLHKRIPLVILIALTLSVLSTGCREGIGRFSHKRHVEQGVSCDTCHQVTPGYELPAMPDTETCTTCHDVGSEERLKAIQKHQPVPAECVKCHFGKPRKDEGRLGDIGFSHEKHSGIIEEKGCEHCHEDKIKEERPVFHRAMRAGICLECHGEGKEPLAAPMDHGPGMERTHGQDLKEGFDPRGEARCMYCHRESACIDCHQHQAPADHTNQWRQRGHGIAVEIDRDRCARCHEMDYCVRCHAQTAPRNHTAGWSGSSQRHCAVCHWPLSAVGCAACHAGTPGHDTAPAKPGGTAHLAGSPCRDCHRPGAGLPHPDDNESCERCHR